MKYHIQLAIRSLFLRPFFSALVILIVGLGIGASMTMSTVLHVLNADPVPASSNKLYRPQLGPRGFSNGSPTEPPTDLTWVDAMNLISAQQGDRKAAMIAGRLVVKPSGGSDHAFFASARYTTEDFFQMFDVPIDQGTTWGKLEDDRAERVAVISKSLSRHLFGDAAVGKVIHLGNHDFRVIGVIGRWNPKPHFYDLGQGSYAESEQIFIPLSTSRQLNLPPLVSFTCWGEQNMPDPSHLEQAPCAWVQVWVELRSDIEREAYEQFLGNYVDEQNKLGRFSGTGVFKLRSLSEWIDFNKVIPEVAKLQAFIAFGFLIACLFNASGLMLVMLLRRKRELGLRRALGASQVNICAQLLTESGGIGICAGIFGVIFMFIGLWVIRQQPQVYYSFVYPDTRMVILAIVLALGSTLISTLLPAWQVSKIEPFRMLKG